MTRMYDRVRRFFDYLSDKKVAFVGVGVTNTGIIKLLAGKGIAVTVCERKTREQLGALGDELEALGVTLKLGPEHLQDIQADVIFRAPGVRYLGPELVDYRRRGVAVTSEMEVFFALCPAPIVAVTGSDGKTTTTTIISELLKAAGRKVYLGGNIGVALLPLIEEIREEDICVVELSSFQLMSMRQSPAVSVLTNIAPNHLDVHGDMQEYIDAKKNILLHQDAFSRSVLNLDNEITASLTPLVRGECRGFSVKSQPQRGTFLSEDDCICMALDGNVTRVLPCKDIRIPGRHNVENYMAAIAAVWGMVPAEVIPQVAREFGGVEHRIELTRELDGVRWYNDSIASSPTRTIAGLNSFHQKVILIAGGYDKKIPYLPLAPKILEKVKLLILLGATAPKIEDTVRSLPEYSEAALPILHPADLAQAVEMAREQATDGDVVLFSPASASFDLYPNFEVRGRHFKELVNGLK